MLSVPGIAVAGGAYGPPAPMTRADGGLHTAFGYWYQEDKFKGQAAFAMKQHQLYSELGYGFGNHMDLYARIGLSTLKVSDAFSSSNPGATVSGNDFSESWKFFTTIGAKGYYPLNRTIGIGAFLQGTYYFSDFTDNVSGTHNGVPYTMELGIKNLWDIHFGISLQATIHRDIRVYIGPCIYYGEGRVSPSANIPGLAFSAGDVTIRNTTNVGGYAGLDMALPKSFRLLVEGHYAERLSTGLAIAYIY